MVVAARVTEVAVTEDGGLYVALSVWATRLRRLRFPDRPDIANDFVFDIERERVRIVRDVDRNPILDADGKPVTEVVTMTRDELRDYVRGEMRAWIRRHVQEQRGNGDFRSAWIQRRRDRDPRGLLADVDGIAGEEFDE